MSKDLNWIADLLLGVKRVVAGSTTYPKRSVLNISGAAVTDNPGYVDPDTGEVVGATNLVFSAGGTVPPFLLATLRSTAPSGARDFKIVDGYALQNDGGGGMFVWNASDTRADDSGTIVQVTSPPTATGRWTRIYNGGLDPKWYGAKADGATNDATAMGLTDAAATALSTFIHPSPGTYHGNYTLANRVQFSAGAIFDGTITLNEAPLAGDGQQIFTPTSVITFGQTALRHFRTMHVNWWGAKADSVTNDYVAVSVAFAAAQAAAQSELAGGNGFLGPELAFGSGTYLINQPNTGSSAAILELKNIQSSLIVKGTSLGSTYLSFARLNSPVAYIQRTNCQRVQIRDLTITAGPYSLALISGIAVGDTTVNVSSVPFGAYSMYIGQALVLRKAGQWYEEVKVASIVDSTHITIDRKAQHAYATGDLVCIDGRACIRDYSDVSDPGYAGVSTHNHIENVSLGSSGTTPCRYGYATECNGGTGSASDVGNDLHSLTNVVVSNPTIGGVFIGHENSIQILLNHCDLSQGSSFRAIHAPNGGTVIVGQGCSLNGSWDRLAWGGKNSHANKIFAAQSESVPCPLLVANQWIPQCSFTTADFTQPAVSATVTVTVDSTANWSANGMLVAVGGGGYYTATVVDGTHLTLTNLGYSENVTASTVVGSGTNIGQGLAGGQFQFLSFDDVSAPQRTALTGTASSGQKVVPVAAVGTLRRGQVFSICNSDGTNLTKGVIASVDPVGLTVTAQANLTQSYAAGAVLSLTYYVDVTGSKTTLSFDNSQLAAGQANVPGDELHVGDPVSAQSSLSIFNCQLGVVGYTLENCQGKFVSAGFTVAQTSAYRETLLGVCTGTFQIDCVQPTAFSSAVQPYPAGAFKGLIPTQIRVSAANSPYTAVLDTETVVDTSTGPVTVNWPVIPQWHACTLKHDESSGSLATNAITLNAGTNQSLAQLPPNQNSAPVTSIVFNTAAQSGTKVTWRHCGSALISAKQPLLIE